ncbi:unnamed protein product [Closterium sp. NIES-53]
MLALCREHRLEHRTKHIALRYFLARELQQRGQLRLAYVASEANTADIFTKALPPGDHQRFCTMLACFALLDWSCDLLLSYLYPTHFLVHSFLILSHLGQAPTVGLHNSAAAQRRQKGADGVEPRLLFLTAFSDDSYALEPEDMKSVGGFIFCVGGGPNSWESKKQVDQALSSVESEYMALFCATREIVWQRRLLAELGEEQQGPTPLYCDSQGAIDLAKNPVLDGLTKHMRVKWNWTRSMVAAGEFELPYVKATRQPADMMTKRLVEQQHWKCCKLAGRTRS